MNRLATIDIGTNSVLLTVVEHVVGATGWSPLRVLSERATITRLGQGLGKSNRFHLDACNRTKTVLKQYLAETQSFNVDSIKAVGTAAFRRATNALDFVQEIERDLGLCIAVISGEREAELSFRSASHDFGDDILVLDIGGGSTEFIWKPEGKIHGISIPIGSVVLLEKYITTDPIEDGEYQCLKTAILSEIKTIPLRKPLPSKFVALAGTATTLAAVDKKLTMYSHDQVHASHLSLARIKEILDQLKSSSTAERRSIPGIEVGRADVIPVGTTILYETMSLLGYEEVTISDRGVRWGLIYEVLKC